MTKAGSAPSTSTERSTARHSWPHRPSRSPTGAHVVPRLSMITVESFYDDWSRLSETEGEVPMPKLDQARTLRSKTNLARHIVNECDGRGRKDEKRAARMTAAGVRMQGSAAYKIEHADPLRRITVGEVVGLATMFDVDPTNLLPSVEVASDEEAATLGSAMAEAHADLTRAARKAYEACQSLVLAEVTTARSPTSRARPGTKSSREDAE